MKYLSICIPNYNRQDKLKRLLNAAAQQIMKFSLEEEVQICISDDCSINDPIDLIEQIKENYPVVDIIYKRNSTNMGMDYNFLNSVMIADSKYCWIVGNDDLPTDEGIKSVVNNLKAHNDEIDLMVTPFDVYDDKDEVRTTIYPLKKAYEKEIIFDTNNYEDYKRLIDDIAHNSGLFAFLSNTIFKRDNWVKYKELFSDKLNTIFIQMYMNIHTLKCGAAYLYYPEKIIKNYADDEINDTIKRLGDVLCGLYGVVDYFFDGEDNLSLQKSIVDDYVVGVLWDLPKENKYKQTLEKMKTHRSDLFRKYFIPTIKREEIFKNRPAVILGTGNFGRQTLEILKGIGANIVAVIDSNPSRQGEKLGEYTIQHKEKFYLDKSLHNAVVVVANSKSIDVMIKELEDKGLKNIALLL